MRIVLVANGILTEDAEPLLRREVDQADTVIGVDGGTYHLLRLGLRPDIVTGDFDSLHKADRERLAAEGVRVIATPDQDYTDLDKAIVVALDSLEATELRIFAATSGRLDHVYSVLSTVIKHGRRGDIRLVDETAETFLIPGTLTLVGDDLPGRTLSLLAFGRVEGVTTTGVRWPLNNEILAPGFRDGTLNEVTDKEVRVTVENGDLLLMLHHSVA